MSDVKSPTEIRFYHLQRMPVERALGMILQRIMDRGQRALVYGGLPAHLASLDKALWADNPNGFLPHGLAGDAAAEAHVADQPIWLTDQLSTDGVPPNAADILLQIDGATADAAAIGPYAMCCDLFDGQNEQAVADARQRWVNYRDAGFALSYWQETPNGGWEQKAAHSPDA